MYILNIRSLVTLSVVSFFGYLANKICIHTDAVVANAGACFFDTCSKKAQKIAA